MKDLERETFEDNFQALWRYSPSDINSRKKNQISLKFITVQISFITRFPTDYHCLNLIEKSGNINEYFSYTHLCSCDGNSKISTIYCCISQIVSNFDKDNVVAFIAFLSGHLYLRSWWMADRPKPRPLWRVSWCRFFLMVCL